MKKIILLVVILLVLGGGGAGGWWFFGREAKADTPDGDKPAAHGEKSAGGSGAAKGEGHGDAAEGDGEEHADAGEEGEGHAPAYLPLPQMIIPVVKDDKVSQVLVIVLALEVSDPEKLDQIKALEPKLRDAAFRSLYGAADRNLLSAGAVLDVERLKARVLGGIDKAIGKGRVKTVLVQSLTQKEM